VEFCAFNNERFVVPQGVKEEKTTIGILSIPEFHDLRQFPLSQFYNLLEKLKIDV
jgi:hypothetical protein